MEKLYHGTDIEEAFHSQRALEYIRKISYQNVYGGGHSCLFLKR